MILEKNLIRYITDLLYDFILVPSHFKLDTCHLFIFLNISTKNEILFGDQIFFYHNDRQYPFKSLKE
jgi:hypothetical protein